MQLHWRRLNVEERKRQSVCTSYNCYAFNTNSMSHIVIYSIRCQCATSSWHECRNTQLDVVCAAKSLNACNRSPRGHKSHFVDGYMFDSMNRCTTGPYLCLSNVSFRERFSSTMSCSASFFKIKQNIFWIL